MGVLYLYPLVTRQIDLLIQLVIYLLGFVLRGVSNVDFVL